MSSFASCSIVMTYTATVFKLLGVELRDCDFQVISAQGGEHYAFSVK
jgi:hypothetical protein